MYADFNFYENEYGGNILTEDNAKRFLRRASRDIDTLTYRRILNSDISTLTEFQQRVVKEVCCELAEFIFNYEDILDNPLSGYGINGVSVSISSGNTITTDGGVTLPSSLFRFLSQTGLCTGVLR